MPSPSVRIALVAFVLAAGVHCGRTEQSAPAPPASTASPLAPASVVNVALVAPLARTSSSSLALARAEEHLLAFVVDEDAKALHAVDLETARVVSSLELPATPGHVVVHGHVLAVSLRETTHVRIVSWGSDQALHLEAEPIEAPLDPLALFSDGTQLTVASASSATLARGETRSKLPRDPRAVLAFADGFVHIAHATGGALSTVDTHGKTSALGLELELTCTDMIPGECMTALHPPSIQSYALARYGDALLVPSVSTLIDGPFPVQTKPPRTRRTVDVDGTIHESAGFGDTDPSSGGYGNANVDNPITSRIDVIARSGETMRVRSVNRTGAHECTLPRGLAVDETNQQVWLACVGDGQVIRYRVKESKKGRLLTAQKDRIELPFVQALAYDAPSEQLVTHLRRQEGVRELSSGWRRRRPRVGHTGRQATHVGAGRSTPGRNVRLAGQTRDARDPR